jgi:uncharacterized delta-60 repeat protein
MKISSKKVICVSIFLNLLFSSSARANDSTLDSNFGLNGKSILDSLSAASFNNFQSLIALSDGKFIQVGSSDNGGRIDFSVSKFNTIGTLDTTFDGDGIKNYRIGSGNAYANGIAQQADGKFVLVGYTNAPNNGDFAIIRINADGSLDTTFGEDGVVTTDFTSGSDSANSVAIQSDGKIVVTGSTGNVYNDFAVARYTVGGVLDNTFSSDGQVTVKFAANSYDVSYDLGIQTDGKIVVAGYTGIGDDPVNTKFAVARFNENGILDNTFSSDGKVDTNIGSGDDNAHSLLIQFDGKIVLAGSASSGSDVNFALVRYISDGTLDTSFSSDGISTLSVSSGYDYGYSVLAQSDGKFLLAGASSVDSQGDFALARFNNDGSADTSFGSGGFVTTDFGYIDGGKSIAMQSTGQILVSGETGNATVGYKYAVARYGVINSGSSGGGSSPVVITNPPATVVPLNITNPSRISNSTFRSYSGEQLATIAPSTFKKIPNRIFKLLTSDQAKNLTNTQLSILTPLQVSLLSQSVIGALNETQLEALQPKDFNQMSEVQISKISASGARGLSSSDIKEFSTAKLRKLKPTAVANLNPNTLKALTVAKLGQLTQKQKASITVEQRALLSKRQINAIS